MGRLVTTTLSWLDHSSRTSETCRFTAKTWSPSRSRRGLRSAVATAQTTGRATTSPPRGHRPGFRFTMLRTTTSTFPTRTSWCPCSARADGRHFTVRQWRKLAEDRGYGRYLPFYILSSSTGRCDLVFSYVFDQNGSAIRSAVRRRITSVNPPLLVDYDRDGRIDSSDALAWIDGRLAYFWKNDDKFKGDDAFSSSSALNSGNGVVDGRNDLVNFLTIGVDVSAFASRWSALDVDYRIVAYSSGLRNAKLALADIQWSQIGDAAFGEDFDIHGNALHEAPIATLGTGTNLPPSFVALSHTGRSTLFVEFPDEQRNDSLYLRIYSKSDGSCLYSQADRKSTRLNSSHPTTSRMPSSA